MSRIMAVICLALTLLCPVLCFAETAGERPVAGQSCDDVCEGMAVGAVIDRSDSGPISPFDLTPSFEGYLPVGILTTGFHFLPLSAIRPDEPPIWPVPATRRHALLQTFLF